MAFAKTIRRCRAWLALGAIGLATAGCNQHFSPNPPAAPPEYERRHPILLTRATQTATIEIGSHRPTITGIQQSDIAGFARAFRMDGEGAIAVNVPSGTANEAAAAHAARDIRRILEENGVPAHAIAHRPYRPEGGVPAPPIVLSYTRLRASVPHVCAVTTDIDMGFDTQQWENYGCATQRNLAAIVANPNDLQGPRPMDRPPAQRRYEVLDRFYRGSDTSTEYRNPTAGSASRVGVQ
jgi:pilus assembly protein CpaD